MLPISLILLFCLYVFLSPRDTSAELKLVFEPRVIRRGLRVRFPRRIRIPKISFPPIRFSILGLLFVTAVVAVYIGYMQAIGEPLFNAIVLAFVPVCVLIISLFIGWNSQGRGVLRRQRANFRPAASESDQPLPAIEVDSVHKTSTFVEKSFPELG